MSEFELLAQDLLEKAEAEEQLRQENDKKLLGQVLEIYDQKYVAELLRKVGKNEWSRETLNRWINGKCSPKTLTLAEEELLRKMLPEAPAHHPDYAFRFIDLFAGIGGIRKGFETIGGQCVFTSEWNKEAVRTYKANWFNDAQEHTFNLDIREVTLSDKPEVPENDAYAYINEHVPDHDVLQQVSLSTVQPCGRKQEKTRSGARMVSNVRLRERFSSMWRVLSAQKNLPSLFLKTLKT